MTPNFEYAIPKVLDHEGGFVNDPDDPGLATKYGVSLRALRKLGPVVGDLDGDGDVDEIDISLITVDKAKEIYHQQYWSPYYDTLDPDVAYRIFDMRINAGPKAAHRCAQRAALAHGTRLVMDGVYGGNTHQALKEIGPALVPAYRSERAAYYRELMAKNPVFEKYRNGWIARAYS